MRAFAMADLDQTPALAELPVPEPVPGEVRVRVRAASVNGFDLAQVAGYMVAHFEHRFPMVLGKDFAGEVDAVAPDVTGYAPGDRVFGTVTKAHLGDGTFADYVTVATAVGLARLPDAISFTDGAALGLAGSAAAGVVRAAELEAGQTVLVVGASGGVGTQVVQHAKAAGTTVLATAHTEGEQALVTSAGADVLVDHTVDVVAQARKHAPDGVDVVFHLAGGTESVEAVRAGGRFVSLLILSPDDVPTETAVIVPVFADPTPATLDKIAADAAGGATSLTVQHVYPLEQTADALAAFAGGTLGKVVISTG